MNAQYSLPGYDHPIIRWLLGEGRRITEPMSFLGAFAEQLRGSGIEVDRVSIGVPILHPQVYAFSGIWEPGKGAVERRNFADANSLSRLARSPVKTIYEGGGQVRRDLTAAATRVSTESMPTCAGRASLTISPLAFPSRMAAARR
ncbi:MAG TPA: hypothetical protein VGQ96_02040 [Candidatus Eremiobacteraceae bacterium]|nr:hypothetical protein [Candidatus Eremiobacteraceae bacterium]